MSKRSVLRSIIELQVWVVVACFFLGCAGTAPRNDPTPVARAAAAQPEPKPPMPDPFVGENRQSLAEVEAQGPGERASISHLRPVKIAVISGCFTLKQTGPDSFSYWREFDEDEVLVHLAGMTPGREQVMVQQIEVGDEATFSISQFGEHPREECFPVAAPSIVRVVGRIAVCGVEIIAEDTGGERLTFAFSETYGLVYLRGTGRVILGDGTELVLGR